MANAERIRDESRGNAHHCREFDAGEPPLADQELTIARPGREHLITTSKDVFKVHSDALVCGEREYVDECLRLRGEEPLTDQEVQAHHLREVAGPLTRIC